MISIIGWKVNYNVDRSRYSSTFQHNRGQIAKILTMTIAKIQISYGLSGKFDQKVSILKFDHWPWSKLQGVSGQGQIFDHRPWSWSVLFEVCIAR